MNRHFAWIVLLAGCPTDETDTDTPADTDTDGVIVDTDTDVAALVATIVAPAAGEVVEGEVVALEGLAAWDDGGAADDALLIWMSSRSGQLGTGEHVDWTATDVGTHTITLLADVNGAQAAAEVDVTVVPAPEPFAVYGEAAGVPVAATWRDLDVLDDGRVAAATDVGLVLLDDGHTTIYDTTDGLGGNDLRAVMQDHLGEVWIGYSGIIDRQGERVTVGDAGVTVNSTIAIMSSMELTQLHAFVEIEGGDDDGDVWMGSNEGLCRYVRAEDRYQEHLHPTHPHQDTLGVAVTSDGHVWNGDQYQLSRWAGWALLVEYDKVWDVADDVYIGIHDLAADGATLWVASTFYGVARVDTTAASISAGVEPRVPEVTSAHAIEVAADGTVWIGASDGLWLYDPVSDEAIEVGDASFDGPVKAIAFDDAGDAWLATADGLVHAVGVRMPE